jgi:hypothetical protein
MRLRASVFLAPIILATVASCVPAETPAHSSAPPPIDADLRPMTIRDPADHWEREGFVELVPAVRLPTTKDGDDRIRVLARLPEGAKIRVDWLAAQERHTVGLPAGAVVDRVESWAYDEPSGALRETVVDVRGVQMTDDGPRYHVLRPASDAPNAPLLGWSWPAADVSAHEEATVRLAAFLRGRPAPGHHAPLDEDAITQVIADNDCGSCHVAEAPEDPARRDMPRRATDSDGSFALLMVLEREMPISRARPLDLNHRDRYVQLRCRDGARLVEGPMPSCPGDESPVAVRDVSAGLSAGDAYTQRLCASREYLWAHMDATAREAFAEAFAECGLVVESVTLARTAS